MALLFLKKLDYNVSIVTEILKQHKYFLNKV